MSSVDATPDLPEPTATGSFAKTPLAHLLVYAQDRELTGTFDFLGPAGQHVTVLFIEGQPTKARTSEAAIYLGRVLFEIGVLSEEQLAIVLPRLLGSTELHGQALLREGLITEEQLELGLRAQLVRQMQSLKSLPPETTYRYYDCFDGLAAYGGDGHVGIDPFPVVWACIRDEPPWDHVGAGLGRVGALCLRLAEAADTTRFAFDKAERAVVELLRQKPWRVQDLAASSAALPPRTVQLLVYCLLVTKQVELVADPQPAPSPADAAPDAPPSSPLAAAPSSGSLAGPGAGDVVPAPQKVARVQLLQRPVTRSPFAVVEAPTEASRLTPEGEDGRTSYVATQPRSFTKKRPITKVDVAPVVPPEAPLTSTAPLADAAAAEQKTALAPPPTETVAPAVMPAETAQPVAPPEAMAAAVVPPVVERARTIGLTLAPPKPPVDDVDELDWGTEGEPAETPAVPPVVVDPPPQATEAPVAAAPLGEPPAVAPRSAPPPPAEALPPSVPPRRPPSAAPAELSQLPSGEALTAPPPPLAGPMPDIFHIPTPATGLTAVDAVAAPGPELPRPTPEPAKVRRHAEVHDRPTVPKMAVVTPEQMAEFAAAAEARARQAAEAAEEPPPPPVRLKPPPSKPAKLPEPRVAARPGVPAPLPPAPAPLSIPTPLVEHPVSEPEAQPSSSRRDAEPRSSAPDSGGPVSSPSTPSSKSHPISLRGESIDDADSPPSSRSQGPPSGATPMTAELNARKKEIVDKAAVSDKEDYYTLLGVARDAPSAEIQKTFFGLAKKWHPDRVPPALADVKDQCAKVFARMSEAHQTLMDAQKRAKYDAARKPGGDESPEAQAQVVAILGAATDFQKAEICLRRNDFKQAEEFCKKALDADPKPADYIAMMAWLQSQKPTRQDMTSTQQQIAELTRAIGISQACERAFFYRAMLLKRAGQEPQAMKDFKRALELNPRNVDAQRELRIFNMRGGAKKEESSGGIFGKLFKK